MKIFKLIFTVWLAGVLFPLHSQNWQSVGGGTSCCDVREMFADTTKNLLYVVGTFQYAGDSLALQIAAWNGTSWEKVGNGSGDTNCIYGCNPILSVIKYNNDLFIGGGNDMMGGRAENRFLSRWDGAKWDTCGKPNAPVWNLKIVNNELFALGYFDSISNKPAKRIAKWNGSDWDSFGTDLPPGVVYVIGDAAYYKGEYYFGGSFNLGNGFKEIIRWDGTQWKTLENGILGNVGINTMVVYKGILFVGGLFRQSSGNPRDYLIAWDGQHWFDPFPGIYFMSQVKDLQVFDDKLYIVGSHIFDGDSGLYAIAMYDGINFYPSGGRAIYPYYPDISKIAVLNGNVYVACNRELFGDTVNYIAQLVGNLTDTSIYMPLSINSQQDIKNYLNVFPNPFSVSTTMLLSKPLQNASLTMYNILGDEVKHMQNLNGSEIQITRDGLKNGLYFYNLIDSKGLVGNGKLIIE